MTGDTEKQVSCLVVAIQNNKTSAATLEDVVAEINLWEPQGIPYELHLAHVYVLQPSGSKTAEHVQEKVRKWMRERFVPILDKLPDACDWDLHVLTVMPPTIEGDTNRNTLSPKAKKYVAAALCRQAIKLGATELVVNKHDKKERSLSTKPLAEVVIGYSTVPVRVVDGSGGKVTRFGKGKDASKVLSDDPSFEPERSRSAALYPEDKTDAYSTFKKMVKGVNKLFKAGSGKDRRSSDGQTDTAAQSNLAKSPPQSDLLKNKPAKSTKSGKQTKQSQYQRTVSGRFGIDPDQV